MLVDQYIEKLQTPDNIVQKKQQELLDVGLERHHFVLFPCVVYIYGDERLMDILSDSKWKTCGDISNEIRCGKFVSFEYHEVNAFNREYQQELMHRQVTAKN